MLNNLNFRNFSQIVDFGSLICYTLPGLTLDYCATWRNGTGHSLPWSYADRQTDRHALDDYTTMAIKGEGLKQAKMELKSIPWTCLRRQNPEHRAPQGEDHAQYLWDKVQYLEEIPHGGIWNQSHGPQMDRHLKGHVSHIQSCIAILE